MSHPVTPFRLQVPEADLRDLRDRLAHTRWPEKETVDDWSQGVPLAYLRELCHYWAGTYDWRATERRLNALPQFRTTIDGLGIHLMPPLAAPDPATMDDLTDAERAALAALEQAQEWEDGYSLEQSTRPQTIGYGLVDSPAPLCAWIVEKFRSWTDCDGHPENTLSRDELLDNLMLYWLPGTGTSAARLYWESFKQVQRRFADATTDVVAVPAGCSIFPKENPRPSRRWAAKRFTDIRHWNELDRGGHFAAFEQPEAFVDEGRTFFRLVR
ncbi:epoxide hydrolase N-terminal domain-containing protein [Streptosporangium sp. H16]|uniref:epoxide hydrolase N-terminal domain-containing protein n=1 Tax=Streptosporangium sp. H16 TaxID=3444184 RepID=UPI003F7ADBA8